MTRTFASILLLVALGCSLRGHAASDVSTPPVIPGSWQATPLGVRVFVPRWLDLAPALRTEVLAEIDAAAVPLRIEVRIQDPGAYSFWGSSTGLALGHTDMHSYITAAWRTKGTYPLLPALDHEMGHVLTQDRCAGHGAGCR